MQNRQIAMQEGHLGKKLTMQQLLRLAAAQSIEVNWRKGNSQQAVLIGDVRSARINSDWHWHFAEAIATEDTDVGFKVPAGMTFGLVYRGELHLELGGCKHQLQTESPLAFCFTNATPLLLKRHFKAGALVHKFTLGIRRPWLKAMGLEALIRQNRALHTFAASEAVVAAVRSLLVSPNQLGVEQKIQQIANVTTLLGAAATALEVDAAAPVAPVTLEQRLLDSVRDLVQRENIQLTDIHLEDLARSLGSSVSGIQRVAKKCFGQSLQKHIRQAKLANALRAMKERDFTIGEAAFLAGYKQASNFSAAFRKAYGFAPGEIAKADKPR